MNWRIEPRAEAALAAGIDALVPSAPNAHFTQHPAWCGVPADDAGGSWIHFAGEEGGQIKVSALIRVRRTPLLGYCLADIFRGPMADSPESLLAGLAALERLMAPEKPLALRIDPFWSGPGSEEVQAGLSRLGFDRMTEPPWSARTLEIDIDRDPDPLLLSFRKETRYDVRKALKLQIDIRDDLDDDGLALFEELYAAMRATKGAHPRPAGFFRAVRDYCRAWPQRGFFLSSWIGSELLGAIAIFTLGRRALYGYGASSAGHPGVPKTHLLHFMAMQHARRRGCSSYDMGGFGAGAGDATGRTAVQKVNYFKSGFGGREVDFVPAHERILRPGAFKLVQTANRVVSGLRSRAAG
ncbi:MAG TPA: GNAT family N-acetyltransferase [Candidatus Polarisedimenticolia bacterium]